VTSEDGASEIEDLIRCVHRALVARAFIELSLPDHLEDQPTAVAGLAAATHSDPVSLSRLMWAAASAGLCQASDGGYFLTPAGRQLRSDAPGATAAWLLLATAPWMVRAWERLADAVRSGRPSFPTVHGQGFWEYVAAHPDEAAMFDAVMTSGAVARAEDLMAALDWSSIGVVVDVGGGQGLLVASLLGRVVHLRGVVADRAEVIASPVPAAVALAPRVEMVASDFFVGVPTGGDVYLLSRILHDWPDSAAVAILRRCRVAMTTDSRLCVLEQIAPDSSDLNQDEQFDLAAKDLNMLVLVGGQERTLTQYSELLAAAELEIDAVHRGTACDVIQARPVHRA
jgi:hypothetical protein